MPIELYALAEPARPFRYGLVSGFRRLAAFRELHATSASTTTPPSPPSSAPADLAEALAAMVEENAIRADLSPWEQGRIAVLARDQGALPDHRGSRRPPLPDRRATKRSRLRAVARVVEVLDGTLAAPERLSERQALRLANAVRKGFAEIIEDALRQSNLKDPDSQWQLMLPYLVESERFARRRARARPAPRPAAAAPAAPRARRANLVIRRELTREGWCLHFTGREASSALMDRVFDELDRIFTPCR